MNFEHVVVVNDPADPLLTELNREEVWFGLLCRAEDARPFLPGLEACMIVERSESELVRELQFGSALIRDRVTLMPMESIRFESERTASHPGGSLTITIEEPAEGVLVLRFRYLTTLPEEAGSPDRAYAEYVKAAYHQSDLDTVRVIRMIAESGRIQ
ncbi:SRPBCC family protein [Aromatoleum aromaticum]|uniref:DUF1857 domain-containing protein n=1 Tax=Aromatoleum aromaticum (strain DSM 19018 / LMG 30748 / EbN1) TaxID=76114 RepID=Q5P4G1_AROAE|nr:SRPBCC family protein [Aromatoleum aromaticum]NMG53576.1 DUF1857 family protein [Aromatoleum aromaticum]CAI07802.1 conserved hypothetical protein [Aromatoleum aromaticum EbN1]